MPSLGLEGAFSWAKRCLLYALKKASVFTSYTRAHARAHLFFFNKKSALLHQFDVSSCITTR